MCEIFLNRKLAVPAIEGHLRASKPSVSVLGGVWNGLCRWERIVLCFGELAKKYKAANRVFSLKSVTFVLFNILDGYAYIHLLCQNHGNTLYAFRASGHGAPF